MYNVLSLEQPEASEQRAREPPDETQTEPLIVVLLDQLVQVDAGKSINTYEPNKKLPYDDWYVSKLFVKI